jgi:hypothetical protein
LSKNTRWALALIGVVIIIVGAVVIGTGKDNTDAVQTPSEQSTPKTGPTQAAPATPKTGPTSSAPAAKPAPDDKAASGGAGPNDTGQQSGGSSPAPGEPDTSGGAEAKIDRVSPILSNIKAQTVTVDKGDSVMIRGLSEESGEMHVHGYDKVVKLKPGSITRVSFTASIDGEFAIEFHLGSGEVRVGTLRVNP